MCQFCEFNAAWGGRLLACRCRQPGGNNFGEDRFGKLPKPTGNASPARTSLCSPIREIRVIRGFQKKQKCRMSIVGSSSGI
jgi:hypothetical protein